MLPEGTFDGLRCVVTGGSSGIGLAIAAEVGRLGASVALVGRRAEALKTAADDVRCAGSPHVRTYVADVRDRDRAAEVIADIVENLGPVDQLVNAAAGNFQAAPQSLTPNGWSAVTEIVLDGTWHYTQLVGQHLIEHGHPGSIVNIGTTAALIGGPTTVHSTSAKAGVLAMTKSLAVAWAPYRIRVNVMTPGPTEGTGAMTHLFGGDSQWDEQVAAIPLSRMLSRQEAADSVAYLLSDYAGYITGHNLVIDGGRSLGRAGGVFHG